MTIDDFLTGFAVFGYIASVAFLMAISKALDLMKTPELPRRHFVLLVIWPLYFVVTIAIGLCTAYWDNRRNAA